MAPSSELEATVEDIVDDKLDERVGSSGGAVPSGGAGVSRRAALGLAGLLGAGSLVGVGSAQDASGISLDGPLQVDEHPIEGIDNVRASHPYASIATNGQGNGNLQLYDADAGVFFLRASEAPDESGPGPVLFNTAIRGVPEDAAGNDAIPGPLEIADDVTVDGNDVTDVGAIQGSVTGGDRLESLAGTNLSVSNGQLQASGDLPDATRSRLDDAVAQLEAVGGTGNVWRAGPAEPTGGYHNNGAFGIVVETDAPTYLGECRIDADAAGQFTPALYEYDLDSRTLGDRVDAITIQATGGPQTIFLDFLVDEPGQYLLTRLAPEPRSNSALDEASDAAVPDDFWKPVDDPVALRRSQNYGSGWDDDSRNGVTLPGAHNPSNGAVGSGVVDYWYYYFDLEISTPGDA